MTTATTITAAPMTHGAMSPKVMLPVPLINAKLHDRQRRPVEHSRCLRPTDATRILC